MRRTLLTIILMLPTLVAVVWLALRAVPDDGVARQMDRSVVRIFVFGPGGVSTGTGFVLNRDGLVATNFHVIEAHVEAAWDIVVSDRVAGQEQRYEAELIHAFPGEDLAVLKVEGLDRPPAVFADTAGLEKGLAVYAIGFPGAADRLGPPDDASLMPGAVSRTFTGPWEPGAPAVRIIQHTAPTNPGNSGGPLVDRCGHVLGLITQREAMFVLGPGGIPLVTDPVQGVFYASGGEVLTAKLREAGIPFTVAGARCGSGYVEILRRALDNMWAIAAVALSLAGLLWLYRPRPVVHVVVRCGDAVGACAEAVERAVRRVRAGRRGGDDVIVGTDAPAADGKGDDRA